MYRGSDYMASIKSLDEKPFDFGYITAQFYKDYVIIGKEKVSLGQISTEILELSDKQLDNLKTALTDLRKAFSDSALYYACQLLLYIPYPEYFRKNSYRRDTDIPNYPFQRFP